MVAAAGFLCILRQFFCLHEIENLKKLTKICAIILIENK